MPFWLLPLKWMSWFKDFKSVARSLFGGLVFLSGEKLYSGWFLFCSINSDTSRSCLFKSARNSELIYISLSLSKLRVAILSSYDRIFCSSSFIRWDFCTKAYSRRGSVLAPKNWGLVSSLNLLTMASISTFIWSIWFWSTSFSSLSYSRFSGCSFCYFFVTWKPSDLDRAAMTLASVSCIASLYPIMNSR